MCLSWGAEKILGGLEKIPGRRKHQSELRKKLIQRVRGKNTDETNGRISHIT